MNRGLNWRAIKQIAYGPLNLTPDSLGKLTHGEFIDLHEGYKWRHDREMEQLAQLASWVTSPHVKKPIDPRKLLEKEKPKKRTTPAETKRVIGGLKKLLGVVG